MITARKGDPVVCSKGHVNGCLQKDIAETDVIGPKDFGLNEAATTITSAGDGHLCSYAQCGERITKLHKGAYQIQTAHGWLGHLEP
jgi:hypothetical protein